MEEVIELDSDMRLQDAQGLPAFLLTPGTGNGVQRPVPVFVNDVSNDSLSSSNSSLIPDGFNP